MLRHRPSPIRIVLIIALGMGFLGAGPALAQDAHYWAQGYGARADLLGGLVVGSLLDLSNTYYNPGALGLLEDPSLLLGTSAFQLISLGVTGSNFTDRKLSTLSLQPLASFVAAPVGKEWAISFLSRFNSNYTLSSRIVTDIDAVPEFPGEELLVGEEIFNQRLTESWGGLTWSKKVRENVGFGLTTYGTIRNQNLRRQTFAQAVASNDEAASVTRILDYSFYTAGLVWKAGLAFDHSPLTWGVSMTTPTLGLFGSGKAFGTRSTLGLDLTGDGQPDPNLVAIEEDGLKATYHSPLSVAAGAQYRFNRSSIFVTAEWFDAVSSYPALELPGFVVSTAGDTLFLESSTAARAVFNVGVGLEYVFTDRFKLYASMITDFSSATGNPEDIFTTSTWDLYQVSLGSKFAVSDVSLILGLGYAYGSKSLESALDEDLPEPTPGKATYRSVKLIVGLQAGI